MFDGLADRYDLLNDWSPRARGLAAASRPEERPRKLRK